MTTQQSTPPDPTEAYVEEYRRLWAATVATLTAAVRLNHPQHGSADLADFLASALGAVAGNVGSAERITAGRPGSWESDLLAQLVSGTVGYDPSPQELARRRTVPVVVRLNVAQLAAEARLDAPTEERAAMLPDLDDALQPIYKAGEEWQSAHPAPAQDAAPQTWTAYEEAGEAQGEREQAAEDALRGRYAAAFEAYAERFAAAVLDEGPGARRPGRAGRGEGRDRPRRVAVGCPARHHQHPGVGRGRRPRAATVGRSSTARRAARARRDPARGDLAGGPVRSRS